MSRHKRNVVFSLRTREIKSDSRRSDFNTLKTLVVHSTREFKKVWSKQSSKMFSYEGGCLFSENYRLCHAGYAVGGGLKERYQLPKPEMYTKNKIEEAIIYKCYHENFHKYENRACLVGILSRHLGECLVQYDLNTGKLLKEVFLSNTVKFKHISWVEANETFVIKSKHMSARSRFHMATGISMNIAIVMAVFSAFPLQFIGMFEVDRRIFGAGITNAILSHSFLIVMYITGHVRFYSFPYILEKFKVSNYSIDRDQGCSYSINEDFSSGASLPVNIKITECPPVLFEVKCADHDVQINGFPWHYIITPHGSEGIFTVHSLLNDKKCKNGTLHTQFLQAEPDRCVFHEDNSGRILHISAPEIKLLKINSKDGIEKSELETVKTICLKPESKEEVPFQVTSSGRLVRRRESLEEIDSTNDMMIHQVQYEDELDISWVSATHQHPALRGVVRFHDNKTFDLLREIQLSELCDETFENVTFVDLDTIIHILKPQLGRYVCTVYRLSGDQQSVEKQSPNNKGTSHKHLGKSSSRRTTRRRAR